MTDFTDELRYVKVPENHIVVDFDIHDKNGEKKDRMHVYAATNTLTYVDISEKKEKEEK